MSEQKGFLRVNFGVARFAREQAAPSGLDDRNSFLELPVQCLQRYVDCF